MPLSSLAPATLVDQAIDRMTSLLACGVWEVGTRVPPEPVLAAQLGVSRNTVREAVGALAHLGLLEVRRGAGTFVVAPTELVAFMRRHVNRHETPHLAEAVAALEVRAAVLAASRRTPADLQAMEAAVDDAAFHRTLVLAAHNPVLAELHEGLAGALPPTCSGTCGPADPLHRSVLDAVRTRDGARAGRQAALIQHPPEDRASTETSVQ